MRQRNAQYLCLDLLLAFVNDMAVRADGVRLPPFLIISASPSLTTTTLQHSATWPEVRTCLSSLY